MRFGKLLDEQQSTHLDHFNMELGDSKMKRGGVRIVEGAVVHIGSAGQQELHSLNLGKR